MKIFLALYLALFSVNSWATEILEYPAPIDISMWQKYFPEISGSNTEIEQLPLHGETKFSPFKTRKLVMSSNISNVAYEKSQTLITAFKLEVLLVTIELKGSKSVDANWINEELVYIQNWPGRCLQLNTIIDIVKMKIIYMAGFNHCGV